MCQICNDLAEFDVAVGEHVTRELQSTINHPEDIAALTGCRHAYVTSDGRCLHCNADCTPQLTAAAERLTAAIDYALAHGPHSPSTAPPSTGKGVQIAGDRPAAPRHGSVAFFCTDLPHGGV